MASRRVPQSKKKQNEPDPESDVDDFEFEFLASQQSTGSDDQALEMAIAQHYAALREKKKKENEQKFLKLAHKQLSQDISLSAEEAKGAVSTLESIFADFLLEYAACEDNIRSLWSQIREEETKLFNFAQSRHTVNVEAGKKIESGHISGLSRTKAACHDLKKIIGQIAPQDS